MNPSLEANTLRENENTISQVFDTVCRAGHDHIGLMFDDESLTFKEFHQQVQILAHNLALVGIAKGDRVAIILDNCKEYLFIYFALFKIGAWAVPLNTRWEEPEIANVLEDAEVNTLFFSKQVGTIDMLQMVIGIQPRLGSLKRLIMLDRGRSKVTSAKDVIDFDALLKKPTHAMPRLDPVLSEDVALLCYTSGTTGTPKGVLLTHGSLVKTSRNVAEHWIQKDQVTLFVAPFYAAQGFSSILIAYMAGQTGYFLSTFTPNEIIKQISRGKCNFIATQPTMWSLLITSKAIEFCDFSSLRNVSVSGSVCSATLAQRIENTVGCELLNVYGCIESTGGVTATRLNDDADIRQHTVGRPLPGFEIKIVDAERRELSAGQVGELAVRGPIMKGYLNNERQTREVIDDNRWLYTGDLACFYDNQNISIVGRAKDMIIRGGFNIYPVDIEQVVLKHPKIQQVAVVGKPHEVIGEQTVAFVVPKAGEKIETNEIREMCRGNIANYKIPDHVHFIAQMPIILAGKVEKATLKRWAKTGIPAELVLD